MDTPELRRSCLLAEARSDGEVKACHLPAIPLTPAPFHRRSVADPVSRARSGGGASPRNMAPPRLNRKGYAVSLPDFTMRQLLEAGAHFGHQSHRWNPKMSPYIYGARNSIHIIDLAQTVPLMHQALKVVSDAVAKGGRVL